METPATAPAAELELEPAARVAVWTGTVHYADATGRPRCGAAARTHTCWMHPTAAPVTCRKCLGGGR